MRELWLLMIREAAIPIKDLPRTDFALSAVVNWFNG
jgi:hypothetical protein